MSVTDIQRAFVRGLDGNGACHAASLAFEDGGRKQRLSFSFSLRGGDKVQVSDVILADLCPMQHARTMAHEIVRGKIRAAVPELRRELVPAALPAPPIQAPVHVAPDPVFAPERNPEPVQEAPAPGADDGLDQLIAAGDVQGLADLLCAWIDADAGDIRAAVSGMGEGAALEYEQIRREINDLAYGLIQPTPADCPLLWASVGIDVASTGDAAFDIRAAAIVLNDRIDATTAALASIRAIRLKAKADVRNARTVNEALQVYQSIAWPLSACVQHDEAASC